MWFKKFRENHFGIQPEHLQEKINVIVDIIMGKRPKDLDYDYNNDGVVNAADIVTLINNSSINPLAEDVVTIINRRDDMHIDASAIVYEKGTVADELEALRAEIEALKK